jgi:hypothetical protein
MDITRMLGAIFSVITFSCFPALAGNRTHQTILRDERSLKPCFSLALTRPLFSSLEGSAVGMVPFFQQEHLLGYGALYGQVTQAGEYIAGIGIGSRYLINLQQWAGAYCFVDQLKKSFYLANIGIELQSILGQASINPQLTVRINTYFPLNSSEQTAGESVLGSQLKDKIPNSISTMRYQKIEAARFGFDISVVYQIPGFNKQYTIELNNYFLNRFNQAIYGMIGGVGIQ